MYVLATRYIVAMKLTEWWVSYSYDSENNDIAQWIKVMIYKNVATETADTLTPIGCIYCNFYHKQNVLTSTEYVQ